MQKVVEEITNDRQIIIGSHKLIGYKNLVFY